MLGDYFAGTAAFDELEEAMRNSKALMERELYAMRLTASFRSTDYIFRIGGDEFAVLMLDVPVSLRTTVEKKLEALKRSMQDGADGLPPATRSIGAAFSGRGERGEEIFRHADAALYAAKENGRNGDRFLEG